MTGPPHAQEASGDLRAEECHAARLHTIVVKATIAYSDRTGFQVAHWLSPLVHPGIRRTARKLWVDNLAYAERRYELRQRGEFPG